MLSSLVLNDSGSSRTSPSRLPRMLVEYQPSTPRSLRLEARRDDGLHPRLPGLQVLAGDRRAALGGELEERRHIGAEIRRRVGVRNAFLDRRVGVDHARRDRGVALLEALLERRDAGVHGAFGQVDLGAAAPDHDEALEPVLLLESAHVLAQLVGHLALVRALLHVGPVEPLDVAADRTPPTSGESSRARGGPDRAATARARRPSSPPRTSCLRRCPSRRTPRRRATRAERSP